MGSPRLQLHDQHQPIRRFPHGKNRLQHQSCRQLWGRILSRLPSTPQLPETRMPRSLQTKWRVERQWIRRWMSKRIRASKFPLQNTQTTANVISVFVRASPFARTSNVCFYRWFFFASSTMVQSRDLSPTNNLWVLTVLPQRYLPLRSLTPLKCTLHRCTTKIWKFSSG